MSGSNTAGIEDRPDWMEHFVLPKHPYPSCPKTFAQAYNLSLREEPDQRGYYNLLGMIVVVAGQRLVGMTDEIDHAWRVIRSALP